MIDARAAALSLINARLLELVAEEGPVENNSNLSVEPWPPARGRQDSPEAMTATAAPQAKLPPVKLSQREIDLQTLDLRAAGMTYRQIAEYQGVHLATAYERVQRAIKLQQVGLCETPADVREIELLKLDRVERALMPVALRGDNPSMRMLLRTFDLRQRLIKIRTPTIVDDMLRRDDVERGRAMLRDEVESGRALAPGGVAREPRPVASAVPLKTECVSGGALAPGGVTRDSRPAASAVPMRQSGDPYPPAGAESLLAHAAEYFRQREYLNDVHEQDKQEREALEAAARSSPKPGAKGQKFAECSPDAASEPPQRMDAKPWPANGLPAHDAKNPTPGQSASSANTARTPRERWRDG